jgi:predicted nucleotidyltransferase
MRQTTAQQEAIVDAFRQTFHSGARLFLFGSRIDDSQRGGDIDLCVETNAGKAWDALVPMRQSFQVELLKRLGDRRIDIVLRRQGDVIRPIDREIGQKGIKLCTLPS